MCFDIAARSPVVNSAISENNSELSAKLSTTTNGNWRTVGICDLRWGDKKDAEVGEVGAEAADVLLGFRAGIIALDGGGEGLDTALEMLCDFEWPRARGGMVEELMEDPRWEECGR